MCKMGQREKNMVLYSMKVLLQLPGSCLIAACAYISELFFQLLSVRDEFIMKY